MDLLDLIKDDYYYPYRRFSSEKTLWYAKYPGGDLFQSSSNSETIFFKTRAGLIKNLTWHAKNLWQKFHGQVEGIESEEEMIEKFIASMEILTI